jgi:hypothetical protein
MKSYLVKRANGPVPLCGDAPAAPWKTADLAQIDQYPWYKGGTKQATNARVVYDDKALYLQFLCEDRHISAEVTKTNGNVCLDSCVEFFATIDPDKGPDYFNVEMNCCGTRLMGFGPARRPRISVTEEQAKRIQIVTSIPGPTRAEQKGDNGWWAAAAVPFDLLSEFTGRKIAPVSGTRWKANFYRCGGKTDSQLAAWNPIAWATPDFHRPEFFGEVRFE